MATGDKRQLKSRGRGGEREKEREKDERKAKDKKHRGLNNHKLHYLYHSKRTELVREMGNNTVGN